MSASVTPITAAEKRYTLAQARQILLSELPSSNDLFQAQICLSQAIAVLDLVTSAFGGKLTDTADLSTIEQAVWAALADVRRARAKIDPGEPDCGPDEDGIHDGAS
jgi:hypothetical protein